MSASRCLVFAALALSALPAAAADSPRFRGTDGGGVFAETGLLTTWPEGGPKLLWSATGLGEGYASVSVAGGHVYTTGKHEKRGSVFAHDLAGKLAWKKEYGEAHAGSGYPGTRTTPTVAGGSLFLLSSMGKAVAMDAASGEVRWEVDLLARFAGENIHFGVSESPLVDGERVIYTPGGKDAVVVALDRKTGKTVWTTKGLSELAAYCNPRMFETGRHRQIVTFVQKHLVGIEPASGELLWRQEVAAHYDIHATSPVFHGDTIYVTHGYDQGGKLYRLAKDGRSVSPVWEEPKLDVHHGGAVVVDGVVYGAASKKSWYAIDLESGEIAATLPRLGKGSVIYADGLLYGYTEAGEVVLVNPDPAKFEVVSSFEIEAGEGHHWAHPVISGGVLYIRHGDVLMAYDVKAGAPRG